MLLVCGHMVRASSFTNASAPTVLCQHKMSSWVLIRSSLSKLLCVPNSPCMAQNTGWIPYMQTGGILSIRLNRTHCLAPELGGGNRQWWKLWSTLQTAGILHETLSMLRRKLISWKCLVSPFRWCSYFSTFGNPWPHLINICFFFQPHFSGKDKSLPLTINQRQTSIFTVLLQNNMWPSFTFCRL
jgi:hypothetical protein